MLQVEKEFLLADTTKNISNVRLSELKYYLDHITAVQTMATLLCGFAYSAYVDMDLSPVVAANLNALMFRVTTGDTLLSVNGVLCTSHTQAIGLLDAPATTDNFAEALKEIKVRARRSCAPRGRECNAAGRLRSLAYPHGSALSPACPVRAGGGAVQVRRLLQVRYSRCF